MTFPATHAQGLPGDDKVVHEPPFETVSNDPHDASDQKPRPSIEIGNSGVSARSSNDREITSSSSMDESIDSTRSISIDAPILTNPSALNGDSNPGAPESTRLTDRNIGSAQTSDGYSAAPTDISEPTSAVAETSGFLEHNGSQNQSNVRESSVGSDAYEPPEPDAAMDNFETISSPPFSPASPRSVESASAPLPSLSITQDDEALTERVQEPAADHKVTGQIIGVSLIPTRMVFPCSYKFRIKITLVRADISLLIAAL